MLNSKVTYPRLGANRPLRKTSALLVIHYEQLRKKTRPDARGYVKALCPCHDDHKPSLSINTAQGWGLCRALGTRFRVVGCQGPSSALPGLPTARPQDVSLTEEYLEGHTCRCDQNTMVELMLARRNISFPTAQRLGLRAMRDGQRRDWLVCVYRSACLEPVYYKMRRADGDKSRMPRYPRGAGSLLYNLPALNELSKQEAPFVVEGELDVAAMCELGYRGVVSVPDGTGSQLDTGVLAPLRRFATVNVAVDDDEAGHRLADRLVAALAPATCRVIRWGGAHVA